MSAHSTEQDKALAELETLFQAKDYEKLLLQCQNLLKQDFVPKDMLFVLDMQHKALRVTDRLQEALQVADKQYAFLLQHFPESRLYKAQLLQNIALLHTQLENYTEAIPKALQTIEILQENPEHEGQLASALCVLSSAYYHSKDLDNAEKILFQALAIWQKDQQEEPCHFQASTCYNNLGRIYEHHEQHDKAILYHTKAVKYRKTLLGDHPETAFCLGNLGTAYASMGEWHKAAVSLQEALDIYAKLDMHDFVLAKGYQANLDVVLQALENDGAWCNRT